MTLKPEDVEKFRVIYKERFNEEISQAEAYESGQNLVNLVKLLMELDQKQNVVAKKINNDFKS